MTERTSKRDQEPEVDKDTVKDLDPEDADTIEGGTRVCYGSRHMGC